jgi:hypothetical protein
MEKCISTVIVVSYILLASFSVSAPAVTIESVIAPPQAQLSYLNVEVNGTAQQIALGQELLVVKGDKIKLQEPVASDRKTKITNVNLIGYQSSKSTRNAEDRGFVIDTAQDINARRSVDKTGELYKIDTFTGNKNFGAVYLRVLAPKLKYAEVNINGKVQVMRENELLKVKAADQVKVDKVFTNIENDLEKVEFQIAPLAKSTDLPGVKFYEIRLTRNRAVFARIPLQVEGL